MSNQEQTKWEIDEWLAEKQKNKFIQNLEIIAGALLIVLLVFAMLLSSFYLAVAAVSCLAIPKLGEKLYSAFFSVRNEMNTNSPATQKKQALASAVENDGKDVQASQINNQATNPAQCAYFDEHEYKRRLNEKEITEQGKKVDFTTKGEFVKVHRIK